MANRQSSWGLSLSSWPRCETLGLWSWGQCWRGWRAACPTCGADIKQTCYTHFDDIGTVTVGQYQNYGTFYGTKRDNIKLLLCPTISTLWWTGLSLCTTFAGVAVWPTGRGSCPWPSCRRWTWLRARPAPADPSPGTSRRRPAAGTTGRHAVSVGMVSLLI